MELEDLKEKIQNGITESELSGVDFKRSWHKKHGQDISAIANNESIAKGWIVVGVNDDGSLTNCTLEKITQIELEVSAHIREYLEPSWTAQNIVSNKINESYCLFIEIKNPQDVVKWDGKAYSLIGTTSSAMKDHEVLELSLRLPGSDYSKSKYTGNYNPSLITSFATKVVENSNDFQIDINKMPPEDILRQLNIYETNTAGILFGDHKYRVVSFDEDGDILDQRDLEGLYRIISDDFIEELQSRSRKKATVVEENSISAKEEKPYPVKALREVLANAVAHSLYQKSHGDVVVEIHPNRITVRNNCTLEAEAFVEKWFSRLNKSNNKHLMNTLRIPRITDEQGSGKIRIFRLMLENAKRAPISEFEDLKDYGRWSVTLFNEEENTQLKSLMEEVKDKFQSRDEWRIAAALLLWRDKKWSQIESYLDDHYKHVAKEVLRNEYSPVWRTDDLLYTKRWAEIRLSGNVIKQFTEAEKAIWYKILNRFSFSAGQDGFISANTARKIIGLSNTQSEVTQLARLFSTWQKEGKMELIKKGQWKFLIDLTSDK